MSEYGNGEFEFINDKTDREFLRNAHWAITQCGLWDWLRDYKPEANRGFMFSTSPELQKINKKMREQEIADLHSGGSYGGTMQSMLCIAKNGYEAFRAMRTLN